MLKWNQYRHFHVVRNLKGLVGKWWNSDIFFIDENGKMVSFLSEKFFYNPIVAHLFKDNSLSQDLTQILHQKTTESKQIQLLEWEKTGLNILAVPIFTDQIWSGLVGVTGFTTNPEQKKKALSLIAKYSAPTDEKHIHVLDKSKLFYMEEMAVSLAQEIIMAHSLEQKPSPSGQQPFLKYGNMIGKSSAMKNLYSLLDKIKNSDSSILIQGENGTGKELVAQSIYKNSIRKNESFVIQNCSALNDNLLESELFGHVKGAFTGAIQNKKGLFDLAHKGTLFLDEIGDTSMAMQAKLLRVLQDGVFFPVGSVQTHKVNVRIIAATNKDLKSMIKNKTFREDLYYRLNVISIKVPPLRERKQDIQVLAEYFMFQENGKDKKILDQNVINHFLAYPWPGNVRELQNEIQRLMVLSQSRTYISPDLLSPKFFEKREMSSEIFSKTDGLKIAIKKVEEQMIARCLKEQNWNKTRVAKKLGISRAALIAKVKSYDLERKDPA